jgi:molecular chaperone IbpA
MFDHLYASRGTSFPFWNLYTSDDSRFLTLAVAGYPKENLSVTTNGNILTIKGLPKILSEEIKYIHRGISQKSFECAYDIKGYMVKGTTYSDGILSIELTSSAPTATVHQID